MQFLWSENGVELARFLRERKVSAIYITDYPGFALDSFSVSPLEYLLKPVDEWRLAAALDWDRHGAACGWPCHFLWTRSPV